MAILTRPSFAPSTALIYITVGALLDVWTAVYYVSFGPERGAEWRGSTFFWLAGFFLTGLILMAIGFMLGQIGRAARQAELSPDEVTTQAAQPEMDAARSPIAAPPANRTMPTTISANRP